MIELEKLNEGLKKLTGNDFEEAEMAERAAGNNYPEISFTKSFQARLAAKALGMNVHELKGLALKEYDGYCRGVFNFLFSSSENGTA